MQRLHTQLQQSQQVAITAVVGLGGIGKTELAIQYARRYAQYYPGGVCWLEARERDIATQILGFAQTQLGIVLPDELADEQQIPYCWQQWPDFGEQPQAALVIVDDVSDYQAVEAYLPPQGRFTLLLTTRVQRLATTVESLAIEILSEDAALELLRQLSETPERIDGEIEQVKALCKWLGHLPLGLELVGRYLAADLDLSLAELQEQLDEQEIGADALTELEPGMTASRNLAKAIELSWNRLSSEAQELAYRLSLFALAPIPWQRVEAYSLEVEPAKLKRLRNLELLRFSLLRRVEQGRYQLHPLIHCFMRSKLADDSPLIAGFCSAIVEATKELDETPTKAQIEAWREMVPHVEEVATQWISKLEDSELIKPFSGLGLFYEGQGRYRDAEIWREHCLSVVQERLGYEHPDVAMSLNNLALLNWYQGRYSDAEPLYLQALETTKATLGEGHLNMATMLNNLANLYRDQGRYNDAEPLFLHAIELSKASLGEKHSDVAASMNNLALSYTYQGRYDDAEPLFLQALEITKATLGKNYPDLAKWQSNLALLYTYQGRYNDAEPLFLHALEITKETLGTDHPDLAKWQSNLASLYMYQDRYSEAEPLYIEVLELGKATLGEDHPAVATRLNNLANLYTQQGRYSEAEPFYIGALAITREKLGENHPNTQAGLNNFTYCLEQALGSGQANILSDHPTTQQLLQQLRSQGSEG